MSGNARNPEVPTGSPAEAAQQPLVAVRAGILIGYARCSTEKQDLTAQRQILSDLGVPDERV